MGLDLGADDYITKPFSVAELLARVRASLRRQRTDVEPPVQREFGDISVDPNTREARRLGELVELTATEFDVLEALVRARGRILSRRQIMDLVWGTDHHGSERTVDNFIAQLRAKLEHDAAAPAHLVTVRGVGYRFVV
jgi:DNA-binding response OmpR family regulator